MDDTQDDNTVDTGTNDVDSVDEEKAADVDSTVHETETAATADHFSSSSVAASATNTPRSKKSGKPSKGSGAGAGRTPTGTTVTAPSTSSVTGLSIPYRTIKKAMKLDPDILIVQNEAALVVTKAAEMFLEGLALESLKISKNHGRSTIRYEDVAEARANDASLAFLKMILP